jgi:hypothetical protein
MGFIASVTSRIRSLQTEAPGFSVYAGKNVTRPYVAGFDLNGSFSHSIRFGYLKLCGTDATRGSNLPLANYLLNIGMGNTGLVTGPNGVASHLDPA